MSRLKFRIRRKDTLELVCCYQEGLSFVLDTGQLYSGGLNVTDKYLIDQFTGLTDKNGVEIFESDILETPYEYNSNGYSQQEDEDGRYIGKVHYQPSKGFIQTHVIQSIDYKPWFKRDNIAIRSTYTAVIGNIHQNKELLEQS